MFYKDAHLVKIIDYQSPSYWYKGNIGKQYWVVKDKMDSNKDFTYRVVYAIEGNTEEYLRCWIDGNDVEIIRISDINVSEKIQYTLEEYPKNKLYIVVGGSPIQSYIGTVTFAGLNVLLRTKNKLQAEHMVKEMFDECGGLIKIIEVDLEN